jgi:hypothetical protein
VQALGQVKVPEQVRERVQAQALNSRLGKT